MKKIVVTGALGHIGSRLIRELPAQFPGAEIVMLDDLSAQRYCSLFNLPAEGRYRFVEADVLTANLAELCRDADAVIHLAAITDAASSHTRAAAVEHVNYTGTERVAQACVETGAAMVFLSTTSVYGVQSGVVDEDCDKESLHPQSPYAESKLRAEGMLRDLGKSEGLRFITCRFGTIVGPSPGMRFHTAVNKFVWQACNGLPLTVWRTALDQKRPYLDISDATRAIAFILDRGLFDGRIYNVLTDNTTVRQIVDALRAHVPDAQVELVDSPIMNQLSYAVARTRFEGAGFVFGGDISAAIADSVALLKQVRCGAADAPPDHPRTT